MNMIQRAELTVHTKMGPGNACTDIRALFERAKQKGITAVAVTDTNSVHAYRCAEQAAREYGVKLIHGCELLMETGGEPCPIFVYVQKQQGLWNLHALISLALGREGGTVTREEIEARRDGLLVAGARELWLTYMNNRPLTEILRFYDAAALTADDIETATGLIELAEEAGLPAFLTGDVRYTDEEDKIAYTILKSLPPVNEEKRHLMSAEELMREADGVPGQTLITLIENSVRFAELFTDEIRLYPDGNQTTLIEIEAGERIKDLAMQRARALYGEVLPEGTEKRIAEEAESAVRGGQARNILLMSALFSRIRAKGRSGSESLIMRLLGVCGGEDLPFPGFEHGSLMFFIPEGTVLPVYPEGPLMRCAVLSLTEPEDAFAMISHWRKKYRYHLSPEEGEKAMKGLTGIARGTMRDPDAYLPLEDGMEPTRYGPMPGNILQLNYWDIPHKAVKLISSGKI